MGQISLFDHSDYLETLAKHKDPLEKLDKVIEVPSRNEWVAYTLPNAGFIAE